MYERVVSPAVRRKGRSKSRMKMKNRKRITSRRKRKSRTQSAGLLFPYAGTDRNGPALTLYLALNPLPNLTLHPTLTLEVGPNQGGRSLPVNRSLMGH